MSSHSSLIAVGHNTLSSIHHSTAQHLLFALCNRDIRFCLLSLGVLVTALHSLSNSSSSIQPTCWPTVVSLPFDFPASASENSFCSLPWLVNWRRITNLHHMSQLFSCSRSASHQFSGPILLHFACTCLLFLSSLSYTPPLTLCMFTKDLMSPTQSVINLIPLDP